ncbi:hydrogenase maturation factor [Serpentinimonas raichei]|jgi:hydrogenase expression/formation protein HypC|uniref:Hydrogenase maturation factor n=1 Tax=Serpentinimonas raichei TaxID=1458425 RepID=A0A060NQX8_9BURK|nr:HypC/HybG/HupF family hydrogenase formation chaperone [Serpentinimonas raichei]BAO81923.1 hydrogenase maturation factor [Serpentinimonas raichei]
MCLAIPALLLQRLEHEQGLIELGGIRKSISLALVPEAVVGDYVIVHVGHAIGLLDAEEAQRTLDIFAEIERLQAQEPPRPQSPVPSLRAVPQLDDCTP